VVSSDGLLKTTIVVERRKVQVGDRLLYATTYNGAYMPPTLRVQPGDRIDLTMTNLIDEDTNLHTHGLHVSPKAPADDIFIAIPYQHSYHYAYQVSPDQPAGTYWYHSHADMMSEPQVAGGESGILVVEGLSDFMPPSLRGITEHTIALKDFQVEGDAIKTHGLDIGAATNRTINGQQNPEIHIRPGETQLWRLANIGANIPYKLHLPGVAFHVIAQDGIPVSQVYSQDTLLIPSGARFDVLVQGGDPGTTQLETLAHDTGPAGDSFPQADLATVVTEGTPMARATLPTDFAPSEDLSRLSPETIADRKKIVYTENGSGTDFYINGRKFDPHRTDFTATLGTVEEWTVHNNTKEDHSFHIHTNDFQLISVNGEAQDPSHSRFDTVNMPAKSTIVVRIRFADFTGRTVFHCHILSHEDKGMMAVLDIVPPDGQSQQQRHEDQHDDQHDNQRDDQHDDQRKENHDG
jgi:FtsP/CotA-like multicopper oxidase with cupredoxin domain